LVQAIVAFAEQELGTLAEISVREDAVRPLRSEKPPKVAGYTPDVLATNIPTTRTLIGEAKTRADLENDHSRQQISAFLRYLSHTAGGIFVLAVPLNAGATARRLVAELSSPLGNTAPRLVILDGSGRS
jgi:hypothetical protein